MSPPRRWIDDAANAPPGANDLLRAAGGPDPSARLRMWEAVQSSTTTAATTATAATAAKTASGGFIAFVGAKPAIVAVALLLAGSVAMRRARPPVETRPPTAIVARVVTTPPPTAPAPIVARIEAPVVPDVIKPTPPVVIEPVRHGVRAPVVRARVAPTPVVVAPAPFTIDDELAAVTSARALLGSDPAAALGALDTLNTRLDGGGVLSHERARYVIDALRRMGRDDEARARAEAFLAAHPNSTVAPAVRALVRL